jgi:hypothetical protein
MTATIETGSQEFPDNVMCLTAADKPGRQGANVGIVMAPGQTGNLRVPAKADRIFGCLFTTMLIPLPLPQMLIPQSTKPSETDSASGCAKSG